MGTDETSVDGRTTRFRNRRPQLLVAVTQYVLDHGLAGLSLRPLADAVGVTHATLLRHFGSKEQLMAEVADQLLAGVSGQLDADPGFAGATSTDELARALWKLLCEPDQQRQFRLLFELAGTHDDSIIDPDGLAGPVVHAWVAAIAAHLSAQGWDDDGATIRATSFLAHTRGLQLDLLITGDRRRVDAAFEVSLELLRPPAAPPVNDRQA
ncbi:TetR/AcrR family transcriptional regulator [Williamsia deligens]|uniref:TetR/AcrR family transcriptional regulator n=1 Tax=Williamsia deligens TaxID=321325 RepID=A0ABW3G9D4_9NOCA|nr:TetR/AcrR family transcriptional regulator [Williamsia deligens]MCP2193633.1 transcriptional regulator, TetR family [Williamsia deligens]